MVDFTRREVVPGGLDAVQAEGALERSLFVTGNVPALRLLRSLSSEARLGLTWLEGSVPPLELLQELGAEYWNPMQDFVTPEGVAEVHEAGRRVSTWTVDTAEAMNGVVSSGVDAVVTNQVAALVAFPSRLDAVRPGSHRGAALGLDQSGYGAEVTSPRRRPEASRNGVPSCLVESSRQR